MPRGLPLPGSCMVSIADEINQPLGAIRNTDAADLLLQSGEDRRDLLRHILADIRRDDVRASEVTAAALAISQARRSNKGRLTSTLP